MLASFRLLVLVALLSACVHHPVPTTAAPPPDCPSAPEVPVGASLQLDAVSLRLVEMRIAERHEESRVFVSVDGAAPAAFGVGDRLGGALITSIQRERVALQASDGSIAWLGTPPPAEPNPHPWIHRCAEDAAEVERAGLEPYLADLDTFAASFRTVPIAAPDGTVLGIRVTGLLNAHPLRSLGMKNGDVVTRIGGMAIVDEESARRAADVVRAADAVDLELLRSGAPLTVHVTIR